MKKNIKKEKVFLVGAGPGDPELITLKGIKCIKKSDVILYDYLASPILLKYAKPEAELIYVGKKGGNHLLSQKKINELMIKKAMHNKVVVRLKGGDPFIFGRGGEEAEALISAGIEFEIVPGITSAIAASAYAGIPLTHRQYTSDITFVTGHEDPNKDSSNIDWKILGKGRGTLVFFMGVKNLASIVKNLKINDKSGNTPAAIIRWGTTSKQITLTGTLDTIVEKCQRVNIKPPSIIVVGQVVNLRKTMKWFEKSRPLMGKTIVVTRARAQASYFLKRLYALGSECIEFPTIKVAEPYDWKMIDDAIVNISQYDWLIFTSVNGVSFFLNRFLKKNKDVRSLGTNIKIAVIGPTTGNKLKEFGLNSDIIPNNYCAESIVDAFFTEDIVGKKICLPRAMQARPLLSIELSKMGAIVDEIPVYRTIKSNLDTSNLIDKLKAKTIDMITFTSSSTVKNFKNMFPSNQLSMLLTDVTIASIGPITAKTARELGFEVNIVAEDYTIDGLCNSIIKYYS